MKKSILAITLLTASAAAHADHKWLMTTPELLISGGLTVGQGRDSVAVKFTAQETLCYTAKYVCINPSLMWFVSDSEKDADFSDNINIGAGVDVKYKIPKFNNNSMYVEAGPYAFIKDVEDNGSVTLHVGTGVEYERITLSIDSYGTSDAITMVNIGYRL